MSVQASQFGDELRIVKGEVAEVNRLISRLQSEIEAVKAQVRLQEMLTECFLLDKFRPILDDFLSPPPSSACQSGEPARRGRGAWRTGRERGQGPDQRPGGCTAESQTGHGQAAQRVPGE